MKRHPPIPPPPPPPEAPGDLPGITQHALEQIREVHAELANRRHEALRLYEPMPLQDEFHRCLASERIVIGGNRSGKSLCTFIEDARAVTGQDPYDKYPKENGNLVIVGRNWPHIGVTVYPMLFKCGAFKIVRDEETHKWRAFRPLVEGHRLKETKPAPPLIPPRFIKDISWVQKNAGYINTVDLVNGWRILFFSSEGEPPQGFQADLVHIDEDINNERFVGEMQARLSDRKGRFVWSAMPHSKNNALLGLHDRAEKSANDPDAIIKLFRLRFLDNAHIDAREKEKNIERWSAQGADEVRMRAEGEFTLDSNLMYPSFNLAVHEVKRVDLPAIPDDWTRYEIGRAHV